MVRTVIRETLVAYRRLGLRLTVVTALIFAPLTAALLALELAVGDSTGTQQSLAILDAVGSLLLFAPLASIIAIRSLMQSESDEPGRVRDEIPEAFALLPRYVLTQLLVLLVIAGLPAALIVGGLAAGSQTVVGVGAGTLIASAIINGVRLATATVVVVTGEGAFATALRRSAQVSRGRYWGALGSLVVLSVIAFAIALLISSPGLSVSTGTTSAIIGALSGLVANAITVPLLSLGLYRLYRTLADAATPVSGA